MRKIILVLVAIGVLAVVLSAQTALDDYGRRPVNRRQAVKLDLALKLLSGTWTDVQRGIILRAINSPGKELEGEAVNAFTASEMRAVFYDLGGADVSDLRAVYAMPFGKAGFVRGWSDQDRAVRLWRANLALGFVRFDLTQAQQQYLIELSAALPLTKEASVAWEQRALACSVQQAWGPCLPLFSRDVGRVLFATIGDGRCGNVNAVARLGKVAMSPTCVCTTNSGNWSCHDSCSGGGSCTADPGNCGFLWLYDCNGMCNNGDVEIQ